MLGSIDAFAQEQHKQQLSLFHLTKSGTVAHKFVEQFAGDLRQLLAVRYSVVEWNMAPWSTRELHQDWEYGVEVISNEGNGVCLIVVLYLRKVPSALSKESMIYNGSQTFLVSKDDVLQNAIAARNEYIKYMGADAR